MHAMWVFFRNILVILRENMICLWILYIINEFALLSVKFSGKFKFVFSIIDQRFFKLFGFWNYQTLLFWFYDDFARSKLNFRISCTFLNGYSKLALKYHTFNVISNSDMTNFKGKILIRSNNKKSEFGRK